MAPSADFSEPGGRPVAVCSKTRTPSFLRSGRAPGRERSCSRGRCSSACPSPDEKRGRSRTREPDREYRSRPALGQSDASVLEVFHPEQTFQAGSPLPKVFLPAQTNICAAVADQSVPRQCESFSHNGTRNDVASSFLLIADVVDKQPQSVKQVASSYVGKLFQAASDQYLSSAKQVASSYVGNLITDVMDKYPEEFPSCAKELPRCLVAEEEVCVPTLIPTYVLRCDEDDCSDFGDSEPVEAVEGVDRSAKCVGALGMTDPSSGMPDDNAQMAPQAHQSSFADYVQDMFEAAFSGNVLEFFEPQNQTQGFSDPESQSVHKAFDILPCAASLKACSRPTFRKRVRPRELPPGEEELPMDCLPSTPPCLSAPEGPSLRIWAEKLQEATFAENVRSQASLSSPCQAKSELGLPMDDKATEEKYVPVPYSFLGQRMLDGPVSEEQAVSKEKTSVVPALPTGQRRAGSRPRPAHRTQDQTDAPKPDTPRHAVTPRPCQQGIISMPEPSAPTAKVVVVPAPPIGPAPNARVPSCRRLRQPHSNTSTMIMGQPVLGALKKVAAYGNMSPRPPPETPPNSFIAALREGLSVRSPRDHGYKSAMAMDLGEEAVPPTEMLPSKMVHSSEANVAAKGFLKPGFAKYSAGLPQISPRPTWGGIEAACGDTWKAHDMI